MQLACDYKNIRHDVVKMVSHYEERISGMGEIIEKSLAVMDDHRTMEARIHDQLREVLARVDSLRRKDFDAVMAPILFHQENRGHEIKMFLKLLLQKQRQFAGELKRFLQAGILEKVPEIEQAIGRSIEEGRTYLHAFHAEQVLIGENLRYLLDKKEAVTTKEFIKVAEFLQGELGITQQQQRQVFLS